MRARPEVAGKAAGKAASPGGLMTQKAVAEFFGGVSMMTIWRWRHDLKMNFPKSIEINGYHYFDRTEVMNWRPPAGRRRAANKAAAREND